MRNFNREKELELKGGTKKVLLAIPNDLYEKLKKEWEEKRSKLFWESERRGYSFTYFLNEKMLSTMPKDEKEE